MGKRKEFQEEPYNIFEASKPIEQPHPFAGNAAAKVVARAEGERSVVVAPAQKRPETAAQTIELREETRIRRSLTLESSEQDDEYQALETRLRQKFGSGVSFSVLGRALFTALLRAEPQILKSADRVGVPSTLDRKNVEKAAEYQETWNKVVINALASAPPVAREG